jgi:predicted DCC family thiol-disulfide oxidoreductase YuxK
VKALYVLYDGECGLCQRCRDWLRQQPAFVELRFMALQSPEVIRRFPGVEKLGLGEELIVVSDEGAVYRGASAWIMCLYALAEYREWAERLAHPVLLPLARQACLLVSKNRLRLSHWFFRGNPEAVKKRLAPALAPTCTPQRRGEPVNNPRSAQTRPAFNRPRI